MKAALIAATGAGSSLTKKIHLLFGSSIVAFLPLNETAGTTAHDASGNGCNGTYTAVALADALGPDGAPMPKFDGSTSWLSWYSTTLNSRFSGAAGSAIIWAKVAAASVWTDTAYRNLFYVVTDASSYFTIRKGAGDNTIEYGYVGGGVNKFDGVSSTSTSLMCIGLTWTKAGDQAIAYYNGTGNTPMTGLGTWSGDLLNNYVIIGGKYNAAEMVWSGWLRGALILNRVATPAEMALLAGM